MTLKPFSKNGGSTRDAFNKKVAKIFEISLHIPSLCMAMYVGVITFYCTPCMYVAFKSFQMSLENKTGKQVVLRTISLHRYPTLQLMNCKWSPLNNLHPQDTKRPQKIPDRLRNMTLERYFAKLGWLFALNGLWLVTGLIFVCLVRIGFVFVRQLVTPQQTNQEIVLGLFKLLSIPLFADSACFSRLAGIAVFL